MRLVEKSDVLVENFAPGVMARNRFDYNNLKKVNPSLVIYSISLAGQVGPLSAEPVFDYMGAACAGFAAGMGESDRGTVQPPNALGNSVTGLNAAMAVVFALLH